MARWLERWMPRGGGGGGVELSITYFQEGTMPLINVRLIENVFTAEQKQQITHDLTEAMVAIEGERMRGVTWCVVEEVKSGDWAIGGQPLTTEAVQALARGDVSLPV
jgi:4-oxalocrotonate tautomerase